MSWSSFYQAHARERAGTHKAFGGHMDFNEVDGEWRELTVSEQNHAWFKRQHWLVKLSLVVTLAAMSMIVGTVWAGVVMVLSR